MAPAAAAVVESLMLATILVVSSACGCLFLQLIFVQSVHSTPERMFFSILFGLIVALYAVALVDASTSWWTRDFSYWTLTGILALLMLMVAVVGPCWTIWRFVHDVWSVRTYDGGSSNSRLGNNSASSSGDSKGSSMSRLGGGSIRSKVLLVVALMLIGALYVFACTALPSVDAIGSSRDSSLTTGGELALRPLTWLEVLVGKVALFGVVGMGVLGGYAAFSTPHAFLLPYLSRDSGEQSRLLLQALHKRQRYLLNLWTQKQRQVALLKHRAAATAASSALPTQQTKSQVSTFTAWISDALARGGGSSTHNQTLDQLQSECDGITKVSLSIFLQTQEVLDTISIAERGRLLVSRLGAGVGIGLSVYAAAKVVVIAFNVIALDIVLGRGGVGGATTVASSSADAGSAATAAEGNLPRIVSVMMQLGGSEGGGAVALTRAAVVFNALTILISLRGFLLTTFRLTSSYASSVGPQTMVMAFSTSMGAYFVGQVLMLRLQLPRDSHSVLLDVIGPLPLVRYQRLNDLCFLGSAVASFLLVRYVLRHERSTID